MATLRLFLRASLKERLLISVYYKGAEGMAKIHQEAVADLVGGTLVECNTAYEGSRNTTERHIATFKQHGWSDLYAMDLLDAQGPDMVLEIPDGKRIKKNYLHIESI